MAKKRSKPTEKGAAEPEASRPHVPGYGIPKTAKGMLPWSHADERLARSLHYWVATTSRDGRPHTVPVWGVWVDGAVCFGGGTGYPLVAEPEGQPQRRRAPREGRRRGDSRRRRRPGRESPMALWSPGSRTRTRSQVRDASPAAVLGASSGESLRLGQGPPFGDALRVPSRPIVRRDSGRLRGAMAPHLPVLALLVRAGEPPGTRGGCTGSGFHHLRRAAHSLAVPCRRGLAPSVL